MEVKDFEFEEMIDIQTSVYRNGVHTLIIRFDSGVAELYNEEGDSVLVSAGTFDAEPEEVMGDYDICKLGIEWSNNINEL